MRVVTIVLLCKVFRPVRPYPDYNFSKVDPLDFLAQVTQHIPNKGEHQIRYYGWYSNKRRGMRGDNKSVTPSSGSYDPDEYWEKLEANTALSLPFL